MGFFVIYAHINLFYTCRFASRTLMTTCTSSQASNSHIHGSRWLPESAASHQRAAKAQRQFALPRPEGGATLDRPQASRSRAHVRSRPAAHPGLWPASQQSSPLSEKGSMEQTLTSPAARSAVLCWRLITGKRRKKKDFLIRTPPSARVLLSCLTFYRYHNYLAGCNLLQQALVQTVHVLTASGELNLVGVSRVGRRHSFEVALVG